MLKSINNKEFKIKPEMSRYIKEQTNKWLEKFDKSKSNESKTEFLNYDLVKNPPENCNCICEKYIIMIPFVSFFSFLVGYKFSLLSKKY